jgi:uncharacterized membrane protein YkvA (DUF1232 family)
MRVTIELERDDIERFEIALARARRLVATMDEVDIIAAARQSLAQLPLDCAPSYVRRQFEGVMHLVDMLEDDAWSLPQPWREDVLVTLVYLGDPEDLIHDEAEVIGLLDDAIMLELLLRRQAPALRGWQRFNEYRGSLRPGRGSAARVAAAAALARRRASLQRAMARAVAPAPAPARAKRKPVAAARPRAKVAASARGRAPRR